MKMSSTPESDEEVKVNLLGEGEDSTGMLPMNHLAALSAVRAMARSAPVGITQLNLFSAVCVLFLAEAPVDMWLKVLVVPLPIVFLPLGLSAIMLSKLADNDDRALDLAAAFVLTEFLYVFALGGIILPVMTEAPVVGVAAVTALLIASTVLAWRSTFNYPKGLKSDFSRFLCTPIVSGGKISTSFNVNQANSLVHFKNGGFDVGMGYGSMGKKAITEGNNVRVVDLVIKHPMLAKFIKYCFNIFIVLEIAVYTALVAILFTVSEQCWQPLLSTAFVSPLFLLPLYSATSLRDAYMKKYTMEPPDSKK